jgi:uncharacterized membrane protein
MVERAPMRTIIFATLLVGCLAYAFARGGRPERVGVLILIVGSVLTVVANSPLPHRYASVETGVLVVDVGVLLAYLALALLTDRYWPLWTTALQLLVVFAHLAKAADPEMLRNGYGFILAVWSYLQLLIITMGTRAHHRRSRPNPAAPCSVTY